MSTPTVCMGLSMLALITEPKFFKINFIASQPTVIYLKKEEYRYSFCIKGNFLNRTYISYLLCSSFSRDGSNEVHKSKFQMEGLKVTTVSKSTKTDWSFKSTA